MAKTTPKPPEPDLPVGSGVSHSPPPAAPPPSTPTPSTTPGTARYRPKPGLGKHFLPVAADGTVQLTPDQARAWRDRFDPV